MSLATGKCHLTHTFLIGQLETANQQFGQYLLVVCKTVLPLEGSDRDVNLGKMWINLIFLSDYV